MLGLDTSDFQYGPLQKHRVIRILTLLPGSGSAEIQCELHHAQLDDNPVYQALSYAWGDLKYTHRIRLDGHHVNITINLATALYYLRHPTRSLKLWVDALCIDQANDDEKSLQVELMNSVYKQCSQVYIWLGDPTPDESTTPGPAAVNRKRLHRKLNSLLSRALPKLLPHTSMTAAMLKRAADYATFAARANEINTDPFALVQHFYLNKHIHQLPCFYRSILTGTLHFSETPAFLVTWNALCQLLRCPWWNRFWCVQEALLPEHAVVVYGQYRITWAMVKTSIQNHLRHLRTCCSTAEKLMSFRYYFVPDSLLVEVDPYFDHGGTSSGAAREEDIETLLRSYRYKDCKHPHDKVYGILGTVDRAKYSPLRPDYSLSVGEVYTNAMTAIIAHHKPEDGLRFLTGEGFNSPNYGLPSWVRDLSVRPDIAILRHEMTRMMIHGLYSASPEPITCTVVARTADGGPYLRLSGRRVSTITRTTTPITTLNHRTVGHRLEEWLRAAGLKLYTSPDKAARFWRTVLADTLYDPDAKLLRRYDAARDEKAYYSWIRSISWAWVLRQEVKIRDEYVLAILVACYGRAMFVTARGNLGLGGERVKQGDQVWVLRGGRVPFVLRREDGGEEGTFRLVGDCYLDGFMDGHGFEEYQEDVDVVLS